MVSSFLPPSLIADPALRMTWQGAMTLAQLPELARWLCDTATAGDVWVLQGPMGSGKTTLVQAMARHWGVTQAVTSPTYGLMSVYSEATVPLVHVDAYRATTPQLQQQLMDELTPTLEAENAVVLVEWGEQLPDLAPWVTGTLCWLPTPTDAPETVRHLQVTLNATTTADAERAVGEALQ